VKELSRGMNVKLMIAVALSHNAELLILDEPTSGLDPVARDEVCDMLIDFVSDGRRSVLFSTHITSDLEKVADLVTLILGGRIVFSEDRKQLLEKYMKVNGTLGIITDEQKKAIKGFRCARNEFEGIMIAEDAKKLGIGINMSIASLDDIVVYINKERDGDNLYE